MKKTMLLTVIMFVIAVAGVPAAEKAKAPEAKKNSKVDVIEGFEDEGEPTDKWDFDYEAEGAIVSDHATEGKKAMKLSLPEATGEQYPGFFAEESKFNSLFPNDWTGYEEFQADVFNDSETGVLITVKFKSNQKEIYNKEITLPKKKNYTIKIKTKDMKVELGNMTNFKIFVCGIPIKSTLYIDNIRLVKK